MPSETQLKLASIVAELQDLETRKRKLLDAYNALARSDWLANHEVERVQVERAPTQRDDTISRAMRNWKE